VLVAVDLSDSMDVRDPQREPVEKLRLAKALRLAGGLCSDAQLDDWIAQYEAKRPIQWVKPDEFPKDSERRGKEEEERHKAHDAVCARVDDLTRAQVARRLLSDDGARLLGQLAAAHKVKLYGFAGTLQEGRPDQPEELFQKRTAVAPAAKQGKE